MRGVGIAGSGSMGAWHASRWQALPVRLAGFYDVDPARAVDLASKYGGQAFTSVEALLGASEIVDICTPPAEHSGVAIAAARAGKHVVCEKPIARHLADAQAIIAACESAAVRLFVAHVVRFFPEFARAKAVLDSGALGRLGVVRSVRGGSLPQHSRWFADMAQSGGVTLDMAIHDIDYMRWLCGDVVRVFARGLTFRGLAVDHVLITLRFASGAIGHIEGSWAFPAGTFRTYLELAGTDGLLVQDSDDAQPLEVQYHSGAAAPPLALNDPAVLYEDPYFKEFQHFLDALDSGSAFLVTPHDALEALRVALAAVESQRIGRPVDIATFEEQL